MLPGRYCWRRPRGRSIRRFCAALLAVLLVGCGSIAATRERSLVVTGSDTMLVLNRRFAEAFMRLNPGVSVIVNGGGTAVGVEALLGGEATLCAASRPLTPPEVQQLFEANGRLGVRIPIAQDPLSVWVHPSNPVRDLEMDELADVFSGRVSSWAQLGGEDREIVVVVRPPASGTHRFFRDRVLGGGAYARRALTAAATFDVVRQVAAEPAAIGYGGAAYRSDDIRPCAIDGSLPTAEAVGEGRYPLTRHLVFYATAPPQGLAKSFIDWCQGPAGQEVVAEVGYLPLWRRP